MNNLRIAICLPSKNEADSIGHVLKTVDEGLSFFGPSRQHLIVNVDSQSSDATVAIFRDTQTKCPKISLSTPYGKGGNIRKFLNFTCRNNFSVFGTFDTDLVSIQPEWIISMVTKVIDEGFDFVVPTYQRSPFEASTTNHFCVPLIFAIFGQMIRQPIGGDFVLSRPFAHAICKEMNLPPSEEVLGYGVDIFLTIYALHKGFRLGDVFLNQKVHKPGFLKMGTIFRQVAQTLFSTIRHFNIKPVLAKEIISTDICSYQAGSYIHRKAALKVKDQQIEWIQNNKEIYRSLICDNFYHLENSLQEKHLFSPFWIILLHTWSVFQLPVNLLEPLFIWRAISYWETTFSRCLANPEEEIINQSIALRKRFTSMPFCATGK